MKKIIQVLLFTLMILLIGCSSSHITTIKFNNLDLKLQSNKLYIVKNIDKNIYPGMIIYQETGDKKDEFINSIIITSQNDIKIKIKDFVNNNMDTLKANIGGLVVQSTKILSFNCSGEKITGMVKNFKITEKNKNNYYSQLFFIDNNKGYIISFQSDNQNDNSDFENSLSNLSCTK